MARTLRSTFSKAHAAPVWLRLSLLFVATFGAIIQPHPQATWKKHHGLFDRN
jgi:hypothetical protein